MGRKPFSFRGWYKGWYFRSLKELSLAVKWDEEGVKWTTAETDKYSVFYTDLYGKRKKHYADFFVDDHIIVECKPRKKHNQKTVQLKATAMKQFCDANGYEYQMLSPRRMDKRKLKKLIDAGIVVIEEHLRLKFEAYMNRKKK